MINKKGTINSLEFLFFMAYGIFLCFTLLSTTFYFQYIQGLFYKGALGVSIILLVLKEVLQEKYNIKYVVGLSITAIIIFLIINADLSTRNVMIATAFFVYGGRNISFEKIAKFTTYILSFFLVFIILSSRIGIVENYTVFSGGREREYLGFLYALFPSTIMCNLILLRIYVKKENIKYFELMVLFLANFFIYFYTRSRLAFILSVVALFLAIVLKKSPQLFVRKKITCELLSLSFVICGIISICTTVMYNVNNKIWMILNNLFEGRINLANDAWLKYGVTLFGTKFEMIGNGLDAFGNNTSELYQKYFYIDNWYIQILLRYGFVFFIVVILLLTFTIRNLMKNDKQGYVLIVFVLLALQGIIQDSFFCFYYNTFLFLIGSSLMDNIKKLQDMGGKLGT